MIDAAKHYAERIAAFEQETVRPGGIVLLGSSHFEWFPTDRLLPGYYIVNRGIASDRLGLTERGILHRLAVSAFDLAPRCVVFEGGANDLGELWRYGEPAFDAIVKCYERVVAALRAGLPGVPLLIVNGLPARGRFAGLNRFVQQFNPHVARIAARQDIPLLDFYRDTVDPAGELRADFTEDGLHLNDAGYAIWAERLRPHLPR